MWRSLSSSTPSPPSRRPRGMVSQRTLLSLARRLGPRWRALVVRDCAVQNVSVVACSFLFPSPSSLPAGPFPRLPRVCDCQWDQVPLRLRWRQIQTSHALPARLPRGDGRVEWGRRWNEKKREGIGVGKELPHSYSSPLSPPVLVLLALPVEGVLQRLPRGGHRHEVRGRAVFLPPTSTGTVVLPVRT